MADWTPVWRLWHSIYRDSETHQASSSKKHVSSAKSNSNEPLPVNEQVSAHRFLCFLHSSDYSLTETFVTQQNTFQKMDSAFLFFFSQWIHFLLRTVWPWVYHILDCSTFVSRNLLPVSLCWTHFIYQALLVLGSYKNLVSLFLKDGVYQPYSVLCRDASRI